MALYHHLGMEARHFPTTFETPQVSETKQNPCGLMGAILGSKDTHIIYRRKSRGLQDTKKEKQSILGLSVPLNLVPKPVLVLSSLYGKKLEAW